jgi:hypothetical protein
MLEITLPGRRRRPDGSKGECRRTYSEEEGEMPRGDKSTYSNKQKRQAEHIEEGYEKRGVPEDEAARSFAERSASAKKAAQTRKRRAAAAHS